MNRPAWPGTSRPNTLYDTGNCRLACQGIHEAQTVEIVDPGNMIFQIGVTRTRRHEAKATKIRGVQIGDWGKAP